MGFPFRTISDDFLDEDDRAVVTLRDALEQSNGKQLCYGALEVVEVAGVVGGFGHTATLHLL